MGSLSLTQREYEKRLNRVLEFIEARLQDEIRLDKLAGVACFSPFHFHRIFVALVGEPPAAGCGASTTKFISATRAVAPRKSCGPSSANRWPSF